MTEPLVVKTLEEGSWQSQDRLLFNEWVESNEFNVFVVPNVAPQGFSCFSLTSQKLQLSWNPLSEAEARGVVKGYKVVLELADLEDPG